MLFNLTGSGPEGTDIQLTTSPDAVVNKSQTEILSEPSHNVEYVVEHADNLTISNNVSLGAYTSLQNRTVEDLGNSSIPASESPLWNALPLSAQNGTHAPSQNGSDSDRVVIVSAIETPLSNVLRDPSVQNGTHPPRRSTFSPAEPLVEPMTVEPVTSETSTVAEPVEKLPQFRINQMSFGSAGAGRGVSRIGSAGRKKRETIPAHSNGNGTFQSTMSRTSWNYENPQRIENGPRQYAMGQGAPQPAA